MLGGLVAGAFGMADSGVMTSEVITHNTLLSTFFAMDIMAFQAAVGTLCTDSSSYFIACLVPLPVSLLVSYSSPRQASSAWT